MENQQRQSAKQDQSSQRAWAISSMRRRTMMFFTVWAVNRPPLAASIPATFNLSAMAVNDQPPVSIGRSEEHTSELQSLMRISYAVFCLKKKNKSTIQNNHQ